jgi:hypothetical protein
MYKHIADYVNALADYYRFLSVTVAMGVDEGPMVRDPRLKAEFFKDLYVPSGTEEGLVSAVASADRFVMLVGPRGSGKSTLLHKALLDGFPRGEDYFLLDFKKEAPSLYSTPDEPQKVATYLHDFLTQRFLDRMLGTDRGQREEFIHTALRLFYPGYLHHMTLDWEANGKSRGRASTADDIKAILLSDPQILRRAEDYVMARVTLAQAIEATMSVTGRDRFVIVLDNADVFHVDHHRVLFSLAVDTFHGGGGHFGVVLVLRDKNVVRFQEGAAGDFVLQVESLGSRTPNDVSPISVGAPSDRDTADILTRRAEYALQRYITAMQPDGSDEVAAQVRKLSTALRSSFIEQRLLAISNNSVRTLLTYFASFSRYLLRAMHMDMLDADGDLGALDTSAITSLLYQWLAYGEVVPNLVVPYREYRSHETSSTANCVILRLILGWLHHRRERKATIGEMCLALHPLGLTFDELAARLRELYARPISGRLVELGMSEKLLDSHSMQGDTAVWITPLGVEYISRVATAFEYAAACTLAVNNPGAEMAPPVLKDSIPRVLAFFDLMCVIDAEWMRSLPATVSSDTTPPEVYIRGRLELEGKLLPERMAQSHIAYLRAHSYVDARSATDKYAATLAVFLEALRPAQCQGPAPQTGQPSTR